MIIHYKHDIIVLSKKGEIIINDYNFEVGDKVVCKGEKYLTKEKIVITKEEENKMNIKYYRGDELVNDMQAKFSLECEANSENKLFDRLYKLFNESKEIETYCPFTGKIVCVENNEGYSFTVGKIYYVDNGKFFDDREDTWGSYNPVSLKELELDRHYNNSEFKFIRIVE